MILTGSLSWAAAPPSAASSSAAIQTITRIDLLMFPPCQEAHLLLFMIQQFGGGYLICVYRFGFTPRQEHQTVIVVCGMRAPRKKRGWPGDQPRKRKRLLLMRNSGRLSPVRVWLGREIDCCSAREN